MVFEEKGWVYIRKCCPEHGEFEGLVEKDAGLYRRFAHIRPKGFLSSINYQFLLPTDVT